MRLLRFLNWFLFHSGFSGISFVQIKTASLLFTVSSEAPEFMRHYSQKLFVEESEIFQNTITTFKASLEFFAMCTYGSISLYRFSDKATGALIKFDDLYQ